MSRHPESPEDCSRNHAREAESGQLVILARTSEIARASRWLGDFAGRLKLPENLSFRLALLLDEALSNTIQHGFDDDGRHPITIRISAEPASVHLEIEDAGRPFNPLEAPPPPQLRSLEEAEIGGLGIHFIRQYSDQCRYLRIEGMNHLRLTLFVPAPGS